MLKPKLSREPEKSGGVPALRTLKRGNTLKPSLLSVAPAQAGTMRGSAPMVTIQSGAAGA